MLSKKIRRISKTGLLLVLLFFSVILLLDALLQKPDIQEFFLARLSAISGFSIRTTRIELSFWRGIGLLAHGLRAQSSDGSQGIRAARVRIAMDVGQLLRGRLVPSGVQLVRPVIRLDPKALGKTLKPESTSARPAGPLPIWIPWLKSVILSEGRITFIRNFFSLEGLNGSARLDTASPEQPILLYCQGYVRREKDQAQFRLSGSLHAIPEKIFPWAQLILKVEGIPLAWVPRPEAILFHRGSLGAQLQIEGPLDGPLSLKGDMSLDHVDFELCGGIRRKTYRIPRIAMDFESRIYRGHMEVPMLKLEACGTSFSVGLALDFEDTKDPRVCLEAKSSSMDFQTLESLFPTPLLPPWLEMRLFPILRKGDVCLENLTLQGKVSQFSELSKPDNLEVLSLRFLCRDFRVFGMGMVLPFENVSAEVFYEKGDFTIHRCNATFEDSTLRESSLKILGIAGDAPAYEALLEGSFDLRQLLLQKNMEIISPWVTRKLGGLGLRSGRLDCRATFRYEKGWPFLRTTKGEFVFRDIQIDQERLHLPLTLKEAVFLLDEDDQNPFRATGVWGNTGFQAVGHFGGSARGFPIHWVNLSADLDAKEILSLFHPNGYFTPSFRRPLSSLIEVRRKKNSWSCRGKVTLEAVTLRAENLVLNPPGKEDTLSVDLDVGSDGRVNLNTLRCDLGKSSLDFSGPYHPESRRISPLNVQVSSPALEDLGLRIGKGGTPVKGNVKGSFKVVLSRERGESPKVYGEIQGDGLAFSFSPLPSPVRDCRFRFGFFDHEVKISSLSMKMGTSPLRAHGTLRGWQGFRGEVSLYSDFFDCADVMPREKDAPSEFMESSPGVFLQKTDIRMGVVFERGRWKKFHWGPLRATLRYRGGDVHLLRSRLRFEYGMIDAAGGYRIGHDPGLFLSGHIQVNDQPVESLLESLGVNESRLQGNLTLGGLLTIKGKKREELISSLSGGADIRMTRGTIRKSNVLIKLLDFLSLQKIFQKKPPEFSKEGFYYESITAQATLDKGVLESQNIVMESPVMNGVASGRVDLKARTLDIDLGIRPLETIDTVMSNIPILGHILTGPEKSFLTYYFKAQGHWGNPKVEYIPFKNLGSGVAGVLKRLFMTPVRIFKDLSGAGSQAAEKAPAGEPERRHSVP